MSLDNHSAQEPSTNQIRRWFYSDDISEFLRRSDQHILGYLSGAGEDAERLQINAWTEQMAVLRQSLAAAGLDGKIYFEFIIPRLGKRVDCLLLLERAVLVLEFKVGELKFTSAALDQVWDYALDLRNFHESSHLVPIAPLLVLPDARPVKISVQGTIHDDGLLRPIRVGKGQLAEAIRACVEILVGPVISVKQWEAGRYLPTPTIIEAARALYAGHGVDAISRKDAGRVNLARTSGAIDAIISHSRQIGIKSICLVTGVPGAGKTLVGLDVANRHMDPQSALHSVFLSGNAPLVAVLREALTRDSVERSASVGKAITKKEAHRQVSSFIQNVHHFRHDCLQDRSNPPVEHVTLFDEAQRAWNLGKTRKFMKEKYGVSDFSHSEPEFLISCLERHPDWAVVVCLIGSGQEINEGEAGVSEWLDAIHRSFPGWTVHLSPKLNESQYGVSSVLEGMAQRGRVSWNSDLHLSTSVRSFRAENLSEFVRLVLDLERQSAQTIYETLRTKYPIVLTRCLAKAKQWLRDQARGSERYGVVVSSQAQRLKPLAIDVRVSKSVNPVHWFLHAKSDTRSSYYLEDAATEFQVQGLELDWAAVVWDGDLRFTPEGWRHHKFVGSKWQNVNVQDRRKYLENAYRVLLTRARQGMVIVVPEGDADDPTRAANYYDPTYEFLRSIGLTLLDVD